MNKRFITYLLLISIALTNALGQAQRGNIRIMFYNVENLFDTIDSEASNDAEFLPQGNKEWNSFKYWKKQKMLYQVIAAAGQGTPPDIIGLCEIENYAVLYHLLHFTPLVKYNYQIVHTESPDKRGIDVALLCRNELVKVLDKQFLRLNFESVYKTSRDILYARLLVDADTMSVYVNHWPSRRGGQQKSEPNRLLASETLSEHILSIKAIHVHEQIIVMGDFNDEPNNKSLQQLCSKTGLTNLSDKLKATCNCGTYKYRSHWNMLDQFLVSESCLSSIRLHTSESLLRIFDSDFLLEPDGVNGGLKPFRPYRGPVYLGGFSDHLPIILDFIKE